MTLVKSNHMETLKTLNNHQHYINVLQLSERIQCKIQRLKQYKIEQEIDELLQQTSPTETMIAYYDKNNKNDSNRSNAKYKSLPKLITSNNHSQHSSSSTMAVMQYDKASSITTTVYQSGGSNENRGFDSAVDLYATAQEHKQVDDLRVYNTTEPCNKPLPSIQYNKIKHAPIIHTKKRYHGLKDFIKRTYHLDDIVVTRSKLSYYFVKLFASYDKKTGEKKAVLKLSITSSVNHNLFIIPYFNFTFYHHLQSMTKQQKLIDASTLLNISDTQIQSALYIWLQYYHHQLPSIHHVSHILRQGLGIYIVYCV